MKWIKYQVVQCSTASGNVLVNKKLGYNETNLAIAKNEAYNGSYQIVEDGTPEPTGGTEEWVFTLEDGSTVTKAVHVK